MNQKAVAAASKSAKKLERSRKSSAPTKEEREPSPKRRRRSSPRNADEHEEDVVHMPTRSDSDMEDEDNEEEEVEDIDAKSKYEVRDRVLARDEDGLLYHANIRRKMYGINHHKTLSCLKVFDSYKDDTNAVAKASNHDDDDTSSVVGNESKPEWYYFVHFEGWKSLWDRWVSESDIMEVTPLNVQRMKEVMEANRALQQEVKEKTKKHKIQNVNLFMQLWKQRLDALEEKWNQQDGKEMEKKEEMANEKKKKRAAKKKKSEKSGAQVIQEQADLAYQSCLTKRRQSHIQAIPLAFGLKRVLVEDWEILNAANRNEDAMNSEHNKHDSMVHVLPTKVTIRNALSLYLKEKGIEWVGIAAKAGTITGKEHHQPEPNQRPDGSNSGKASPPDQECSIGDTLQVKQENFIKSESKDGNAEAMGVSKPSSVTAASAQSLKSAQSVDIRKSPNHSSAASGKDAASSPKSGKSEEDQLTKEWTDMANGISIYFEQALTNRLLYPSEVSQLIVLEESLHKESSLDKIDIYGCEHLLRLISILPRILEQQYQDAKQKRLERMKDTANDDQEVEEEDNEDGFTQTGGLILAKLQDLARFLQKNQSTLFCSCYRKKNDAELSLERRTQKRQERRLKNNAVMMQDGIASDAEEGVAKQI